MRIPRKGLQSGKEWIYGLSIFNAISRRVFSKKEKRAARREEEYISKRKREIRAHRLQIRDQILMLAAVSPPDSIKENLEDLGGL